MPYYSPTCKSLLFLCCAPVIGCAGGLLLPTIICVVLFYALTFISLYFTPRVVAKCRGASVSHARDTENFVGGLVVSILGGVFGAVVGLPLNVLALITLVPFATAFAGIFIGLAVGVVYVVLVVKDGAENISWFDFLK